MTADPPQPSVCFPRKPKIPVKAIFPNLSGFLHGCKKCFRGSFFWVFPVFPTGRRKKIAGRISRVDCCFHGHYPPYFAFLGYFHEEVQLKNTGISRAFFLFHGNTHKILSRAPIFFSRVDFEENPHGHDFSFTGTFLGKTSFSPRVGFL